MEEYDGVCSLNKRASKEYINLLKVFLGSINLAT